MYDQDQGLIPNSHLLKWSLFDGSMFAKLKGIDEREPTEVKTEYDKDLS